MNAIRTFDPSGKLKRMRRNADVEVAPSTVRGRVPGPAVPAAARILAGAESDTAAAAIASKHPSSTAGSSPGTTAARGS